MAAQPGASSSQTVSNSPKWLANKLERSQTVSDSLCSLRKDVKYCGQACQRKDWKEHRQTCLEQPLAATCAAGKPSVRIVVNNLNGDQLLEQDIPSGTPMHEIIPRILADRPSQSVKLFHEGDQLLSETVVEGERMMLTAVFQGLSAAEQQCCLESIAQLQFAGRGLGSAPGLLRLMESFSEAARNDPDIMLAALAVDRFAMDHTNLALRGNRDFMRAAVRICGPALGFASNAIKDDREIVAEAVQKCGRALGCASFRLKGDRQIVLAAITKQACALEFADAALRDDRNIVARAVARAGRALEFASARLQGDRKLVLAAVSKNGFALKYASSLLQADRDIVLSAVRRHGHAIESAEAPQWQLLADCGIVQAAVRANETAVMYELLPTVKQESCLAAVSEAVLRQEHGLGALVHEFFVNAALTDPKIMQRAIATKLLKEDQHSELRSSVSFMRAAVRIHGPSLAYANDVIRGDREVVMLAVESCGCALRFASANLRCDREVVLAAVTKRGCALQFAGAELQDNRELVMVAVMQAGRSLEFASARLRDDRGVVLAAVAKNGYALRYASAALVVDRAIVLTAVAKHGGAIQFASKPRRADPLVMRAAMQSDPDAVRYADDTIKAELNTESDSAAKRMRLA